MEELNPWDEGYQAPQAVTPAPTQELNPWDDAYQPTDVPVQEPVVQAGPVVAPEDVRDTRGVPGGPDYVPPAPEEDRSFSMYEGLTPEQAYAKYEEIKARPDTRTSILGEPIVDNTVVPAPELDISATAEPTAEPGIVQMTTNIARGAFKNTILTAAATLDEMGKRGGEDWGLTEMADKAIASRAKGGKEHPLQEVAMQLGEYASGAIAGYKVGNVSGSLMTGGNYSARNAANFFAKTLGAFGSTLGAVVSQDAATQPMAVGPDAFIGTIFEGVPINPDGSMSEQVLGKKTNLFLDELTSAFAAAKVGQAAEVAVKALKHITYDQIKPLFSEKTRELEAVDKVIKALNMSSTDGNIDTLRNAINENMDVMLKLGGEDAMPMNRTTMSAIEQGLRETDPVAARRAMEIEQGLSASAAPGLASRQQLPMTEFKKFQDEMVESRGGLGTIEKARETVARSGISEIESGRSAVQGQEGVVQGAEEAVRRDIRDNPFFGEDVRLNEAGPRLDVNQAKSQAEERVMAEMNEATSSMRKIKDEKYAAIPKDEPADSEGLLRVLNENIEYVPQNILARVTNPKNPLTFQELYNEVLPQISKLRTSELKKTAPDPARLSALEAIYDNIHDEQVEYVATHGSATAKEAAVEARRYFRDDYVPLAKAPVVGPLFEGRINKYDLMDKTQAAVNALKDARKGSSEAVLDLMDRPEYKGDKKDLLKVYLGGTASKWGRQLHAEGGIDKINPEDVLSGLGEQGVILKKRYPEEVKQLEDFAAKLRDAKGNVTRQREILKEAQEVSKEVENRAFGGIIGDFVEKGTLKPKQGGYQIFKGLLNSQKSGNKIDELVKRVRDSGDPLAQAGMETAYLTYLKDRIQEGTLDFSEKQASRLADVPDLDMLKQYGLKIFVKPEEVEDYSKIVGKVLEERSKRVPEGLSLNAKGGLLKERAHQSTRTMINMTLGFLNPTASKVRTVANVLIGGANADAKAAKILDMIASDKEYAQRLLTQYANFKNNEFGDEARSVLWKLAVASGAYTDADRKSFNEQFEQEKKKPVDKETDEILGAGKGKPTAIRAAEKYRELTK